MILLYSALIALLIMGLWALAEKFLANAEHKRQAALDRKNRQRPRP